MEHFTFKVVQRTCSHGPTIGEQFHEKRKILIAIITFALVILLASYESFADESSGASDNQSQSNKLSQNTTDASSKADSAESQSNADKSKVETIGADNNNEDTSNNVSAIEEDSSANHSEACLKKTYLKNLNDTIKETEELEAADSSTYVLKKVENDRWDELLNEIYGVLKVQLPPEEMNQLREEQRNWIKYRDDSRLEASQKYKGGT